MLKIKKRGLSPVIATVLLVAIVVVMGLVIFLFFRGFAPEVATKGGQNIELACEGVDFTASYDTGFSEVAVTNYGNVPIYDLEIKVTDSATKSTSTQNLAQVTSGWQQYGLGGGESFSGPFDAASGDSLFMIPVLLGTTEDGGEAPYVCDEQYGQEIIV